MLDLVVFHTKDALRRRVCDWRAESLCVLETLYEYVLGSVDYPEDIKDIVRSVLGVLHTLRDGGSVCSREMEIFFRFLGMTDEFVKCIDTAFCSPCVLETSLSMSRCVYLLSVGLDLRISLDDACAWRIMKDIFDAAYSRHARGVVF
jgi:hypothetical protein